MHRRRGAWDEHVVGRRLVDVQGELGGKLTIDGRRLAHPVHGLDELLIGTELDLRPHDRGVDRCRRRGGVRRLNGTRNGGKGLAGVSGIGLRAAPEGHREGRKRKPEGGVDNRKLRVRGVRMLGLIVPV